MTDRCHHLCVRLFRVDCGSCQSAQKRMRCLTGAGPMPQLLRAIALFRVGAASIFKDIHLFT